MKIYVIRHGQTDYNKNRIYNCRIDEDINEEGVKQAEAAALKVSALDLGVIVCSPLLRARHTCAIVNKNGVPVVYDERLAERDGGSITGKPYDVYPIPVFFDYYATDLPEGLEPFPALFARIHSLLDEIAEKYAGKNVLLVTHGAAATAIRFYFEPVPEDGNLLIGDPDNCEIKEYDL